MMNLNESHDPERGLNFLTNRWLDVFRVICILAGLALGSPLMAAPPDLRATGAIAELRASYKKLVPPDDCDKHTYNLGATGLRGWIYVDGPDAGNYGFVTKSSQQILVTAASAPGNLVLAVDDVILGAMAGNAGEVPLFADDCRKAFGVAIGEAEKNSAGTLRVKRWRAGIVSDQNIAIAPMDSYSPTAPYTCPKSEKILVNARNKLVDQLMADPNFLSTSGDTYSCAIKGLALLASVTSSDPNYATVQARLQTYARALAASYQPQAGYSTWNWGYSSIFLSEYYLRSVEDRSPDAAVLPGLNQHIVALAKGQSKYGTFGHGGSLPTADGKLHGTVPPYGSVNAAGLAANIALVLGKKAISISGVTLDPEINPAIKRASDYFSYYVNKGSIPYGEHEPWLNGHSSNGKDPMCAVMFGLQSNRPVETEYFTRMSIAGCTGREYGHTGQGFSYLWGALGANVGGPTAVTKYMENVRWHSDLARRTDGSFTYDGAEQYGSGKTADGTYFGVSNYYTVNPTAIHLLSYAVVLKRLYITGRDAIPANTLIDAKVTDAIAAATYKQDCIDDDIGQLMTALGHYDPVVRNDAAVELAGRPLTTEVDALIALITDGTKSLDANVRQAACQTLGIRKTAGALTALGQRLSDSDVWVRAKAAKALKSIGAAASPQLDPMLTAMAANFTDPEVIDWSDPIQISNGYLAGALFEGDLTPATIGAAKNLLYPAVKVGLKQPDSQARTRLKAFTTDKLTLADVKVLMPDLIEVITTNSQADTMWTAFPRAGGIATLAKYKVTEGIALALSMQQIPRGFGWGSPEVLLAGLNALAAYGDAARWTLPTLKSYLLTWNPADATYTTLVKTITTIEDATTAPVLVPGLPVAYPQVVTTEVPRAITLTGYDSASDPLTYTIVTLPAHGDLTGTPPNMTYSPATDFYGVDRFTFKTNDGISDSKPETISIIVGVAGTGLKGEYFNNPDFTALKLTRTDPMVNFDWAYGSPNPLVAPDGFSVRWTGKLLAPETASYRFSTLNSDGVRLWIDGVQVLADYNDHAIRWKDGELIELTAGRKYDLVMEYYENSGSAAAKLKWTGPSFAGPNGVIISENWLYDGSSLPNRAPVAVAQNVTLAEDTITAITLGGGDPFFDALTYTIVTPPAHGTLISTDSNVTYKPFTNYNGIDSFTFTVKDATITSMPMSVGLTITPVNDATLATTAATYAGYAATTASLNAVLSCDEASYSVDAYWGTTDGGKDISQWQNSALVGTRSSVTASTLSHSVTGLAANTRYYFTYRVVSAAGELWANSVQNFGPSPTGDLLSFGLPNQPANINNLAVGWPVSSSATITNLAPTYTLSPGATCNKASGSTQNFTNPVTYIVTAQNGISKNYTVTVTQQPNVTFTWNSTSNGNWSTANKWLNESAVAMAPAMGGQSYYHLNFTNTGTYTATHDLVPGFLLNQLNFNGPTVTLAGTNPLTLAPWDSPFGVIAPKIIQNGSSAVIIKNPLSLGSNLIFGGIGTGQLTLNGLVGAGSLNDGSLFQTGANVLFLDNANNGFPGGLEVINSTLKARVGVGQALGGHYGNWQGTRMKLTNSTLQLVDGGWCSMGFELLGTNTITQTNATYTFFQGGLSGSGILNLTGPYPIAFSGGFSTYTGDIRIDQGPSAFVYCGGVDPLGSGGTVIMATPGGVKMGIENSIGATLDNYIQLDTQLNFSWTYNNMGFILKRNISGPGSLSKVYDTADTGTHLQLGGLNSTYSGGTSFKSGYLEVRGGNSLGTGTVTLGGKATTIPKHVMTFINLAAIKVPNHFVLAGINEPSLTEPGAVTTFAVSQPLELTGNLSGTGGLLKTGIQTLTLSGVNTCSGAVKVEAGVLAYTRAVSLGQGTLDITAGAKVQLGYEGTRQIAALTFDGGGALPSGTYGSSESLAANKDDSRFSGRGTVTISSVPAASAITALALTSGANPSAAGTFLTFTATVAGSAPSGIVNFYCGGALIGSGTLNGSFQASATTRSLSQGWQYVTATYLGDSSNLLDVSDPLELFIGDSLPNAVPVAVTQAVSTVEDSVKPITLSGDDADGDALTYIIVTSPTSGVLSGTGPNLIYTPSANYTGNDSFAFCVNDGNANSPAATVSLTVTAVSDAPVAYPQSISVGKNSGKAITLVGTDADGGPLSYILVSGPTKGALSGPRPNLVYSPQTDYSGLDSFTFRVSDGTNTSATVTVNIAVSNSVFTWNSAVAGNWSESSKWAPGSSAPAAAGQVDYVLDFPMAGNYVVTHDLNPGFSLNQLGFAGAVTLAGGNGIRLSTSGGILPQIDQQGTTEVVIGVPVDLASNVTLGGAGNGNVKITGIISGGGMLTKNSKGALILCQENSYLGGTILNAGTLDLYADLNSPFGTGLVTLNRGATLALNRNILANEILLNGGTITTSNTFTSALTGLITLAGTPTFNMSGAFALPGTLSGPGGIIKTGTNTIPISGANYFTGAVAVQSGALQVASLNRVSGGVATSNLGTPITAVGGTISLGGTTSTGTLKYVGIGETTDRMINLAGTTGGGALDQSGASGLLTFSSNISVTGAGAKTLTLQGSTGGSGKLTGAIVNSSNGTTSLIKSGTGVWTLASTNSYSGATQVIAGTLICNTATSLGIGAVDITTGAKLDLNYVGTRQVAAVTYDQGIPQSNGTYGSSSSSATFKNDTYFTGTGTVTVGPVVGGTTTALVLTTGSSPSTLGAPLTFTATVAGGSVTGSVTFYDGATVLGTGALTSGLKATLSSSILAVGPHGIVAQYTGNGTYTASASTVVNLVVSLYSSYEAWASHSMQSLTAGVNDGPLADPDQDGISNLLEFALGGAPMVSSQAIVPILTKSPTHFVFEYDRSDAAQATTIQVVEYGSDLTGWTSVNIPATTQPGVGGIVEIISGSPTDHIKVTIPNGATKTFVRLKVTR